MKRLLLVCAFFFIVMVVPGCAGKLVNGTEETGSNPIPQDGYVGRESAEETEADMKIKVSDGQNEVIFSLNNSTTAKSLYDQLPLETQVENYSTNEKIFYPPEGLDTEDVIEGDGPFGTLAYFSPWGNVVMYYSECSEYHGLYLLGEAVEGAENIEKLSGVIKIEVID